MVLKDIDSNIQTQISPDENKFKTAANIFSIRIVIGSVGLIFAISCFLTFACKDMIFGSEADISDIQNANNKLNDNVVILTVKEKQKGDDNEPNIKEINKGNENEINGIKKEKETINYSGKENIINKPSETQKEAENIKKEKETENIKKENDIDASNQRDNAPEPVVDIKREDIHDENEEYEDNNQTELSTNVRTEDNNQNGFDSISQVNASETIVDISSDYNSEEENSQNGLDLISQDEASETEDDSSSDNNFDGDEENTQNVFSPNSREYTTDEGEEVEEDDDRLSSLSNSQDNDNLSDIIDNDSDNDEDNFPICFSSNYRSLKQFSNGKIVFLEKTFDKTFFIHSISPKEEGPEEMIEVSDTEGIASFKPTLSFDGKTISGFTNKNSIWVRSLEGKNDYKIIFTATNFNIRYEKGLSFSPDGNYIIFSGKSEIGHNLYRINAKECQQDQKAEIISDLNDIFLPHQIQFIDFKYTPDGNCIVYIVFDNAEKNFYLVIKNKKYSCENIINLNFKIFEYNTLNYQEPYNFSFKGFSISHDSSKIVFNLKKKNNLVQTHEIYIYSIYRSNFRRICETDTITTPFWSPDGKSIVFSEYIKVEGCIRHNIKILKIGRNEEENIITVKEDINHDYFIKSIIGWVD